MSERPRAWSEAAQPQFAVRQGMKEKNKIGFADECSASHFMPLPDRNIRWRCPIQQVLERHGVPRQPDHRESRPSPAPENGDLLAKGEILDGQVGVGTQADSGGGDEGEKEREHPPILRPGRRDGNPCKTGRSRDRIWRRTTRNRAASVSRQSRSESPAGAGPPNSARRALTSSMRNREDPRQKGPQMKVDRTHSPSIWRLFHRRAICSSARPS